MNVPTTLARILPAFIVPLTMITLVLVAVLLHTVQ